MAKYCKRLKELNNGFIILIVCRLLGQQGIFNHNLLGHKAINPPLLSLSSEKLILTAKNSMGIETNDNLKMKGIITLPASCHNCHQVIKDVSGINT